MDTRRTTINLPEDLFEAAKTVAFQRKTTFTRLVSLGLTEIIYGKKTKKKDNHYRSFVGGRALGFKGIRRQEIYDQSLRQKVSG